MREWIAVDFDGTLAEYHGFIGHDKLGPAVPVMLERVRRWIAEGRLVKIFTARAHDPSSLPYIQEWLDNHGLGDLEITNIKDPGMMEIWDDRAVQVLHNTGVPSCASPRGLQ